MNERRSEDTHNSLVKMVAEIREDVAEVKTTTGEVKVALFGLPGQEWMGHIPQTKVALEGHDKRLRTVEQRIWIWLGAFAVIVWGLQHWLR